jgi:hypothetical protein
MKIMNRAALGLAQWGSGAVGQWGSLAYQKGLNQTARH